MYLIVAKKEGRKDESTLGLVSFSVYDPGSVSFYMLSVRMGLTGQGWHLCVVM